MSESDQYYVGRCLDGHPDDFRHLVRRYQGVLLAHLAGQLDSRDVAEEAAQESFVRGYMNLSKLTKRSSFFPWLLGIGTRVAKEMQRGRKRELEAINSLSERPCNSGSGGHYPLVKTIAELPDFYRELILLRYYGGQTCKELAIQLDMPLGTVTKALSRAYAMLREKLGKGGVDCEVQR
jgi:DNA-directed RNA polymerase specialized sigma24 family protein